MRIDLSPFVMIINIDDERNICYDYASHHDDHAKYL
uniref:Uncharacterized protein n=1 Tax=Wuchereria bancrofti TaxID=6293 RepID=A0AAF5RWR6_WUCBA